MLANCFSLLAAGLVRKLLLDEFQDDPFQRRLAVDAKADSLVRLVGRADLPEAGHFSELVVHHSLSWNSIDPVDGFGVGQPDAGHRPDCGGCPSRHRLPCGTSRAIGTPWCLACQRRRAACSACGRHDAIASGALDRPLFAGCTPPPPWAGCPVCSDPDHPAPGQCARCLISARLTEVMGPDGGSLPPGLQALRCEIAAAEHAITATRWLSKLSVAPVLSGLADGSIPLTHQALDELPRRRRWTTCGRPSSPSARCRNETRR